ncbi:ATP-binding protein [Bacteroides sp. 51]|uniref:sensor histidine kinase n=1 Tax=Bacteroides sp. 51 TaxID=2302938 RepID=UPI0013D3107B|nr:ATP-binding protein [Bacteroides sp. 51]NDV82041.1 PAS domain S-box protein [Bacteroides sp. 51]
MSCYNGKSKEELLAVIEALELELQDAREERVTQKESGFREKYAIRILDALTDMLVVFDYEGRLIEMLSRDDTNHVPDVPPAELANKLLQELVPAKEYARLKRTMQKVITTGKPAVGEHSLMLGDKLHYFEHTISPLDDGYLLCVCRDISKRVRAYKELETLKYAMSNAKEGILAVKMDGQLYFANDRFIAEYKLLGDVKNYNIRELLDQDTVILWNNMVSDVRREHSKMRYLIPKPEKESESGTYEVFANILLNEAGEEVLWCFVRDVSLRIKQQSEIARLNMLFNEILDNVPIYLFVKDVSNDHRYLYWNRAFAEHSGVAAKDAIGRNDYELFLDKTMMDRFYGEDLEALEKGRIEYEEETMTASGEKRMMVTSKIVIYPETDHPYIVGLSWDTTEIRKAEKKLIEARIKAEEADKLKSSFLANMSHEIRTPLNAIVGFSKLAIEAKEEEEKWGYIDIVDKNSNLLLHLFNDILDLSAIESDSLTLSPRPVILQEMCSDQFERHRHTTQYGVKLMLDEVDQEVWITTDWDRLGQVISNLLNNAIKFTQKGEIHFGFERKDEAIQFYVKDTGIGISANKIATIFQRFGKVNNFVQGTGLGLALSRMLVEKMGGRIWARSKQGEGTTFYFTLPFDQTI